MKVDKDAKDDETKLAFFWDSLDVEWPVSLPVWKDEVLHTLQWRASVSHEKAKGAIHFVIVWFAWCPFLRCAGKRERTTSEIEAMGKCFKDSGECGAWIAEASDQHLQGVASEVNGPLLDWVVTRLGTSGTPAHDLFRKGSPLYGPISSSGRGVPVVPGVAGDLCSLWDDREKDNLELIDSLKDDALEIELHGLALKDASLKRMSPPMPICMSDIKNMKLHPRFGVSQGVKADGSVKVRVACCFAYVCCMDISCRCAQWTISVGFQNHAGNVGITL